MNCKKCGVSVFKKPLERVNPKGELGIWWCHDCLKEHEPELYNNIMEDQTQLEKDLINWSYNHKN